MKTQKKATQKTHQHIKQYKTDEKHGTKTDNYNDSNQKQNRKQRKCKQNRNITETRNLNVTSFRFRQHKQ